MVRKIGMRPPKEITATDRWEDYLEPGEKLLWQGAPATGIRFTGASKVLTALGVFVLGYSVFWIALATDNSTGSLIPYFGAPFVLLGIWLVFGHWLYDAYKRKRSRYALTNKRALIARTVFGRKIESYPILSTNQIRLESGTLDTVYFAQKIYHGKNGETVMKIGFRYISDGQNVIDLLHKIKKDNL